MRSNKRYTNVTFTKRVDHGGGEHHGPRAIPEPAVCVECGAVRTKRRWTMSAAPFGRGVEPARTVCPACLQASRGEPRGFVTLEGAFLAEHRLAVERLLTREAERAAEDNPLARILQRSWDGSGRLTVATTTEHLAERLGRAVESAFSGKATYTFSHENKLARVAWRRD